MTDQPPTANSRWGPSCNLAADSRGNLLDGKWAETYAPAGALVSLSGYPWEQWCKQIFLGDASIPRWDRTHIRTPEMDARYPYDLVQGIYHTCQMADFKAGGNAAVWQTCAEVGNPSFGFSHFDHVGGAMLSIFQGAAPDGYNDIIWRRVFLSRRRPSVAHARA